MDTTRFGNYLFARSFMFQNTCSTRTMLYFLSHMVGYLEQEPLGQLRRRFVFLKSNVYVNKNFQVSMRFIQPVI
jgi:hypothetical protein